MKQKTKISWIITIMVIILVAFFESKTEYLLSNTKDLEREVINIKTENETLKNQLNYIWETFDLPDDWNTYQQNQ